MSAIDLTAVRELLTTAQTAIDTLDGRDVPQPTHGKARGQEMAEISKSLLFIAHLLDKARVLTLDEYHLARGFTDHLTTEPGASA